MYFFVLGRGLPTPDDGDSTALDEAHWAYMDGFSFRLRGPLLTADRRGWAGSVHVVEVPDLAAARAFAEEDPYRRGGFFSRVDIWRVDELEGGTQAGAADRLYLVFVDGTDETRLRGAFGGRIAWWGRLFTGEDGVPAGLVLVTWADDAGQVIGALEGVADVREIHDWRVGGRR